MYLDRQFSKFMSHLVKAHSKFSNTALDLDTTQSVENLLSQFDFYQENSTPTKSKVKEESKSMYATGAIQTLSDTQGWLLKVRQSLSDVTKELQQVTARQDQVRAVVEGAKKPDFKVTNTLLALIEDSLMETRRCLGSTEVLLRDRAHVIETLALRVDRALTQPEEKSPENDSKGNVNFTLRQSPYTMIDTDLQRPRFKGIDLEYDKELGMKFREILN